MYHFKFISYVIISKICILFVIIQENFIRQNNTNSEYLNTSVIYF